MKLSKLITVTGFLLTLILAGPVIAAGEAGSKQDMGSQPGFSKLDADRDGYLSKQEAEKRSGLVDQWDKIDSNGDDKIDSTEFSAFEITSENPEAAPAEDATMTE